MVKGQLTGSSLHGSLVSVHFNSPFSQSDYSCLFLTNILTERIYGQSDLSVKCISYSCGQHPA